jgi:hypothetical protein
MGKYLVVVEKLKKKLIGISFDDHLWSLKAWDQNDISIVKLGVENVVRNLEELVVTIVSPLSIIPLEFSRKTI